MKKLLLFVLLYNQLVTGQTRIGNPITDTKTVVTHVSLSGDGSAMAIGTVKSGQLDYVRIYKNISGQWKQVGNDIHGENIEDQSNRVALSSDGNTVVIGAPENSDNGFHAGHVRVYRNNSGNWIQLGKDIDGLYSNDRCGSGVAISSDGSIIAIGSPGYVPNSQNSRGQVRLFKYIAGSWKKIGQDINAALGDWSLGNSVALSADGNVVAIAAPDSELNGINVGRVWVYENISGTWTSIGQYIDGNPSYSKFGTSIALSADGKTVAVGCPNNSDSAILAGQVRVYRYRSAAWTKFGADINGDAVSDRCGQSVSLSADGNVVAVGVIGSSSMRVYQYISGWKKVSTITGANGTPYGFSVSLSERGTEVAVGSGTLSFTEVYDLSKVLSSENSLMGRFKVFPNPASEMINIELDDALDFTKAVLYDTVGRVILESEEKQVYVGALAKGNYVMQIVTQNGTATEKIILE